MLLAPVDDNCYITGIMAYINLTKTRQSLTTTNAVCLHKNHQALTKVNHPGKTQ